MSENRRRQDRKVKRVPLRFGPDGPVCLGMTQNLSLRGLEIRAREVFIPNTTLRLSIETPGEADIDAMAVVLWNGSADPASTFRNSYYATHYVRSMGVKILDCPKVYEDFVQAIVEPADWLRRRQRFNSTFQVNVKSDRDLLNLYSQDISHGGVFVLSDVLPELQSFVGLELVIPETGRVVHAEGRVVHHREPEPAFEAGMNPGFGVEFTQFFGADEQILDGYIRELATRVKPASV